MGYLRAHCNQYDFGDTELSSNNDSLSPCKVKALTENESWDYDDANTQYLTHNIHRYSGKFIPQIAARAIEIATKPGDKILDLYCGSGTTLLEAAIANRRAEGIDLNPIAILISKCKITPIARNDLDYLVFIMSNLVDYMDNTKEGSLFVNKYDIDSILDEAQNDKRVKDEWYAKWFQKDILQDLLIIDIAIKGIKDSRLRNIAMLALSDILRKSSNAHSGYPNVMFDKNAPKKDRPAKAFLKRLCKVCDMIDTLNNTSVDWPRVSANIGNATSLNFEDDSIDAIITHPPYIGSIPYAEYGYLSLKWLGYDPKDIDRKLTGGCRQSKKVIIRFISDYKKMFEESFRVLRSGHYIFIMVGNPVIKGETINLSNMTMDIAIEAGFLFTASSFRKGINRRANKMGEETIYFFQKP